MTKRKNIPNSEIESESNSGEAEGKEEKPELRCGVIMPISEIDECPASHWLDVKRILFEAIESANFIPNLVSDSKESRIIHKSIVQNIYSNDMIICDVSGRNPNVMFELGLRLAFDKSVVIVIDDQTPYSFDTGVIEHITYPRDLRFYQIQDFKDKLTKKIINTHKASLKENNSPFLRQFGEFKVAGISNQEIDNSEFENMVLNSLNSLTSEVSQLKKKSPRTNTNPRENFHKALTELDVAVTDVRLIAEIRNVIENSGNKHSRSEIVTILADRFPETSHEVLSRVVQRQFLLGNLRS